VQGRVHFDGSVVRAQDVVAAGDDDGDVGRTLQRRGKLLGDHLERSRTGSSEVRVFHIRTEGFPQEAPETSVGVLHRLVADPVTDGVAQHRDSCAHDACLIRVRDA